MSVKIRVLILNIAGAVLILINLYEIMTKGFSHVGDLFSLFIGVLFIGYAYQLKSKAKK